VGHVFNGKWYFTRDMYEVLTVIFLTFLVLAQGA
jgi:hypothetical protein